MRQAVEPSAPAADVDSGQQWQLTAEHAFLIGIVVAIALAFGIRAVHILHTSFPLNDGGLFYAMASDLQESAFRLPEATTYNASDIPFTYSPLGLYIVALLDKVTPFSLLDLFRLLPLLYTTGTVAAFFLLARRLLPSRTAVVAATFAFALVPRSFIWLLMGGGVTRALGLMLALLALHEVHRTFTTFRMRYALTAALLSGATVLTHLETGWFLAFTIAIFFLAFGKERFSVTSSVVIAGGTLLLALPWLIAVVGMHGTEPFVAANTSGGSVFSGGAITEYALISAARVISTSEPYFPLIATLGVIGLLCAVRHHLLVLPAWWLATILLDIRAFPTFTTVPIALLAGMAVSDVVLPMLDRGRQDWDRTAVVHGGNGANGANGANGNQSWRRVHVPFPGWHVICIIAFLLMYALVGAMLRKPGLGGEGAYLQSLSPGQRAAMHWIEERTPPSSEFLVIPRTPWQVDKESEWFPVLTQRRSVATVQGTEWAPDQGFDTAVSYFDQAWDCGYRASVCLADWAATTSHTFSHVYLPADADFQCCDTLLDSLTADPAYLKLYDGPGGTVFSVVGELKTSREVALDSDKREQSTGESSSPP